MSSRHHVVYGAGAVGGVVGGLLHRAGHRVTLIARGEHLQALQRDGLHLISPFGDEVLPVPAVGDPGEIDWTGDEVVHLAVKSDATPTVLSRLHQVAPSATPVVCLQNGVANEPAALRWFGHVIGVCVMLPATHLEPGLVEAGSTNVPAILDCGRYPALPDGEVDPLAEELAEDLRSAGMESVARSDVMVWKYRKLVSNLGNAVDAACPPGEDRDELVRRARVEGEEVLAAAGIDLVSSEADRERRGDLIATRPGRGGSSTYQSLARGTGSVEVDWLAGEIVAVAHSTGRTAPVNDLVRRAAVSLVGGEARSIPAADLLAQLNAG
ncbi:ketopantoate reductase family protein [Auraticoccus monumenti]|uniref:Ketopantoate reductase n=1 Tax=Auraticoccus monumenti TaxID=675864 RepID=A0A1G6VYX3_9ACTN|nr:2-dehydropantoate 2-reductase N-terminal domain-containing protein [Auraticoccus monumenti]SDD58187.1 ketopantoate reductase [Auraticoccus monumenti]